MKKNLKMLTINVETSLKMYFEPLQKVIYLAIAPINAPPKICQKFDVNFCLNNVADLTDFCLVW